MGTGQILSVDPVIAPKTVSVFGDTLLPPEAVLQNAAYVYGLRVQHKSDSETVLTLPAPAPARTLMEVAEKVEEVTPLPWRRALLDGAAFDEAARNEEDARLVARGEELFDPWKKGTNNREALDRRQKALYRAAVRRLRVLIEPKIDAAPDKRYPMKNVTEEESRLFALLATVEFLSRLITVAERYPPQSLQNWKQAYVSGGRLPGASLMPPPMINIGMKTGQSFFFYEGFDLFPPEQSQVPKPAAP